MNGIIQNGASWSSTATENTIVTVTAKEQHCSVETEFTVHVLLNLTIPSAFTPNGDGFNDEWVIQGLESYDKPSVKVFNR